MLAIWMQQDWKDSWTQMTKVALLYFESGGSDAKDEIGIWHNRSCGNYNVIYSLQILYKSLFAKVLHRLVSLSTLPDSRETELHPQFR